VTGPLHLGLNLPNYGAGLDPQRLAATAIAAEEAGFDSGWVTDHVLVPDTDAHYYRSVSEALVTLAFLAGRTHTLRLGVSALVVAQRNPIVALKQLTSIDYLSDGRLVVAVAGGWLEGEFDNLGASFSTRGRLLDEWLELVAVAQASGPGRIVFRGAFFSVDGWLAPTAGDLSALELWAAGMSPAALRRAATTGTWHPVALGCDEVRELGGRLRETRSDARIVLRLAASFAAAPEEDPRGRHAVIGPPEWMIEQLTRYVAAGCDGFVLNLAHDRPGIEERVRRFGEEVAPSLQRERAAR
jgi:alkanesulfonate monooxygenase SsuD/methylene tetrahydromethanopterin reductase-like flavin-dependent oxidoreductase (luciferase family)